MKLAVLACAILLAPLVALSEAGGRPSGYTFLGAELRALQDDDFANPGMLWVDRGVRLWNTPTGDAGKSCADCHGEPETLLGVASRLPEWNATRRRVENLEMRINDCRSTRQGAPALAWEGDDLLGLTTLVAHQSRGLPVDIAVDAAAAATLDRGREAYHRRRGQLDLSCADCHENHVGRQLRGDTVSAGTSNGFPIYRLTWETLGSRQRMVQWCFDAVRAEPPPWNSPDALALELYLAWRDQGLAIETPAVRR